MSVGSVHFSATSASDLATTPEAVATLFVYGPNGGRLRTELIDVETARAIVRDLSRILDVESPARRTA